METTEKKLEFGHSNPPPWLDKGKCNNNNIFEHKDNFCAAEGVADVKSAKCQCHRSQPQQQQIPVIELPPGENINNDEAGGGGGLQIQPTGTTNGTSFNEDDDELLSTALAAHSPPNSNRTSVNNSTDNLSYNSDNYYVDELIVLQNTLSDEEVSLNSDDCIYAYRGGAEFDIALETRNNNVEDETDFLEMDFDPDPSSEVDPAMELRSLQYPPSIFLSNSMGGGSVGAPPERQLFSSPIEDGEAALCHRCPTNKDFANLSLNLTQIKSTSLDAEEERTSPATVSCTTDDSKSKVTGAKPKRITERSISMTKNRKTQFLYSKMNKAGGTTTSLCSAGSLDERGGAAGFPPLHSANAYTRRDLSDETCLDCLEKEFLANTIGKPIEWSECPKCKTKRTHHHLMAFGHCNSSGSSRSSSNTGICMSSSSSVLCCKPPSSSLSLDLNDLLPTAREKAAEIDETARSASKGGNDGTAVGAGDAQANAEEEKEKLTHKNYQRRSSCDIVDGNELLRTDKEGTTFSTLNVDESTIVQALDKLKVVYNKELIISYFQASQPEFKNIKQFILHQSKKNCNYPKLKKLIELACNGTVTVKYQPNEHILDIETVQVQVADILHQWTRTNNLKLLKQLDKRFIESNILGKIIYIIRQAQQRNNAKPLAEFISIPQYYKSGYISVVTKK